MDIQQHLNDLKALKQAALTKVMEGVIVPAANEMLAQTKNRIMVEGKNSSGRRIGTYSEKPMYATVGQFDKTGSFRARGKKETGIQTTKAVKGIQGASITTTKDKISKGVIGGKKVAVKKQSGFHAEERTSMYLPGGYRELRDIQGKEADFVNLNYTGSTMLSFQLQANGNEVLIGMTDERSALIRQGLEEGTRRKLGYGKIFQPTFTELDQFKETVFNDAKDITISILNA